jgi:hypothetical protein
MPIIACDIWITREGQEIEIKKMPSSHLLATIHFIERRRFEACFEVYQETVNNGKIEGMLEYYSQWPIQYETLIKEAQRRGLIFRQQESPTKESDNAIDGRRRIR